MTNLNTSTLRPGLLVSLRTGVSGGITYFRKDIEAPTTTEEGKEEAKWETERVIDNVIEYKAADKAATKAGALIRKVCTWSAFGLLCPTDKKDALDEAMQEARAMVEAFNATSTITKARVNIMTGRIAADDAEALKSITSEVRGLMDSMQQGISNIDVKKIRDAAYRAKQLGAMLQPSANAKLQEAVDAARTAARKIVKAGEQAGQAIDREAIKAITSARTAFLDLDDDGSEVKAPVAQGKALDLDSLEVTLEKPNGSGIGNVATPWKLPKTAALEADFEVDIPSEEPILTEAIAQPAKKVKKAKGKAKPNLAKQVTAAAKKVAKRIKGKKRVAA